VGALADGVQVHWVDAPPIVATDTLALVSEALLPVLLWPNLPVLRAVEHRLSIVERFLVEAALDLGDITTLDLEEIAGIPAESTERVVANLRASRILTPRGDAYVPDVDAARTALDREALVELRPDHVSLLMLPRSGDALAFDGRQGRNPPRLDRLEPAGHAPVPEALVGCSRIEVVRELFASGRVAGLPDTITDVGDEPESPVLDETCPVYRATGVVDRVAAADVGDGGYGVDGSMARLRLYHHRSKQQVPLELPGDSALVRSWRELGDCLAEPAVEAAALITVLGPVPDAVAAARLQRPGPVQWTFSLGAPAAQAAIDQGRSLAFGGGLEIEHEPAATRVEVAITFTPSDAKARSVFALDRAADLVARAASESGDQITTATVDAALASAAEELHADASDLSPVALRRHLWGRGRHDVVYRIRAAEDFAYG
jgi:hypothetical protein